MISTRGPVAHAAPSVAESTTQRGAEAISPGITSASTEGGVGLSGGYHLVDDDELANRQDPGWTVDGMLPASSLAVLYGQPGTGKSLLALDLALSLSCLTHWCGRIINRRGPAIYVAAEGAGGLAKRISAWKQHHLAPGQRAGCYFLTEGVPLLDSHAAVRLSDAVLRKSEYSPPSLVVLDTLSRCLIGGDENSARDMGLAIAGADSIRHRTGAAVIVVHHPIKSGRIERGSGALRGAADTVWSLKAVRKQLTLECSKQKDALPFAPVQLRMLTLDGSVVLGATGAASSPLKLTPNRRKALETLSSVSDSGEVGATEWNALSGLSSSSHFATIKDLLSAGYVTGGDGTGYAVTEEGRRWLQGDSK
jgi:hypothetical protein